MTSPIETSQSNILLIDTSLKRLRYAATNTKTDSRIVNSILAWVTDFQASDPLENASDTLKNSAQHLKFLYVRPPAYVTNPELFRKIFSERIAILFPQSTQQVKRKEPESSQSSSFPPLKRSRNEVPNWETAVHILSQANQEWVKLLEIPKVKEIIKQDLEKIEELSKYSTEMLNSIAVNQQLLEFLPHPTLERLTVKDDLLEMGRSFLPLFKTHSFVWKDLEELSFNTKKLNDNLTHPIVCSLLKNKYLSYAELKLQAYKAAAEEFSNKIKVRTASLKEDVRARLVPLLEAMRGESELDPLETLLTQIRGIVPVKLATSFSSVAFKKSFSKHLSNRLARLIAIFQRPTMIFFLKNRLMTVKAAEELQNHHFIFLNYLRLDRTAGAQAIADGNIADLVVSGLTSVENLKNFTEQQLQFLERTWKNVGIIRDLILAKALTVNDVIQLTDEQVATIKSVVNPFRFLEHVPKEILLNMTKEQAAKLGEPSLRKICLNPRFGVSFKQALQIPESYFKKARQEKIYNSLDTPEAVAKYFGLPHPSSS